MHLCDLAKAGKELKSPLPPDLIPPTFFKKTRQNSLTSVGSNEGVQTVTSPQGNQFFLIYLKNNQFLLLMFLYNVQNLKFSFLFFFLNYNLIFV